MPYVSALRRGSICMIRLEHVEARNAMTTQLLGELLDGLTDAAGDAETRCVVLTGSGGAFSAGPEAREELDVAGHARRRELLGHILELLASTHVPTIAAVHGACSGGGAELAASCDIRVAEPTAAFSFTGASTGYPIGAAKLVGLVGLGTAKDLLLTSRTMAAEEAARVGLVQHLVSDDQAIAVARELAERVVRHDPEAVAHLKRMLDQFAGVSERIAVENDTLLTLTRNGGDYAALAPRHRGAPG